MIINAETFEEARKKLAGSASRAEGIEMLKKMLEIKQAHLWRSEVIAPCCGSLGGFACQLNDETSLLEKSISLLEDGKVSEAQPLLDSLGSLINCGMGQQETPDLVERLTASPKQPRA